MRTACDLSEQQKIGIADQGRPKGPQRRTTVWSGSLRQQVSCLSSFLSTAGNILGPWRVSGIETQRRHCQVDVQLSAIPSILAPSQQFELCRQAHLCRRISQDGWDTATFEVAPECMLMRGHFVNSINLHKR